MINDEPELFTITNLATYQAGLIEASSHRNTLKICDEVLNSYELTTMQWLLIGAIFDSSSNEIRLTDLADKLNTGLPYLTNMINHLEHRSIIKRLNNKRDSRAKTIILTPKYSKQIPTIEKELRQQLRNSFYSKVSEKDFATYLKVMIELAKPIGLLKDRCLGQD